jgi:gliding motility-associated protein GldM
MRSFFLVISLMMISIHASGQERVNDAVVAAANMNVIYRGVSNPIEIAVPGVKSEKVSATITNGTILKSLNRWEVNPGDGAECTISVMVDGKKVADKKFRVKLIPPPQAVFAGKSEGILDKFVALQTNELNAELKDFMWDLKFAITGFTFLVSMDGMDYELVSEDNLITEKMKSLMAKCEPGKSIIFKDIMSMGPDGRPKKLDDIILKLK